MQKNRFLLSAMMVVIVLAAALAVVSVAAATADTTAPVVTSVTPVDGSTMYTNGTSSIYYQSGNSTPLVIKADYSDEVGGSGVDTNSVMVHLDGGNMLFDCTTATTTHVECTATAADLAPGTHSIDIYVADLAGNQQFPPHRTYVTVVVDSVAPTYANLSPAGGSTIYTSQLNSASLNDMSALRFDYDILDASPSSGVVPMSHVNDSVPPGVMGAMISNTSCVKTPDAYNTTHYSCQVNRAKLLHLGDNNLAILLKDRVGNQSSDYSDGTGRNHYTVVDDVAPVVSGIAADMTTISASYSDPAPTGALSTSLTSGINVGTAMVHVDGMMIMSGCSATSTGISCSTPTGLSAGIHSIELMVSDNTGTEGMATGTLCVSGKPGITVSKSPAFWADYAAYTAGNLSMRLRFTNSGPNDAFQVTLTGSSNTNLVTLTTATPFDMGDLVSGASTEFVVNYHIPAGVHTFKSSITGSASDACGTPYTYPV